MTGKPLAPGEFTLRWLEHEKKRFPAEGQTRAEFERAIEDVKALREVLEEIEDTIEEIKLGTRVETWLRG